MTKNTGKSTTETIRKNAERLYKTKQTENNIQLSESESLKLIKELQIHQIELELQNEELIQAKEKAEDDLNRFRSIVENTNAGYFFINNTGLYQEVNQALVDLYKYESLDEIIGKHFTEVLQIEEIEKAIEFVECIRIGDPDCFQGDYSRKCKDGTIGYHTFSARPVYSDKKIIGIEGFIIDTTKQKLAEIELAKLEKKSNLWLENSPVCTKILDFDFNLQFMSQSGINELQIEDINEFYGKPYPFHFYPDSFKIPMNRNLRKAKETGKTITQEAFVNDIKGNKLWYHSTIVPVYDNDNILDYIMVVSLEITKSKNAEQELIKAKEKELEQSLKFEKLFEQIQDPIFIYNPDNYEILEANKATAEIYGYSEDELIGMSCLEFSAEVDKSIETGEKLRNEGEAKITYRHHKKKDGTDLFIELNGYKVCVNGKDLMFIACKDITAKVKAEQEIIKAKEKAEENEAKYNIIAEYTYDWETYYDNKANILFVNGAFEKITGYNKDDFRLKKIQFKDFVHKEDLPEFESIFDDILTGKPIDNYGFRIINKNGEIVFVEICSQGVYNSMHGLTGVRTSIRDISDRKQAEQEIIKAKEKAEESEERYYSYINNSSEGVCRLEMENPIDLSMDVEDQIDFLYDNAYIAECNQRFAEMYNASSIDELIGKKVFDLHGDRNNLVNRETGRELIEAGYKIENIETIEKTMDGKEIHFSNNSLGIIKDNKVIRIWCTQRDITDRKKAEQELIKAKAKAEENENKFRTVFKENNSVQLLIDPNEGYIVDANKAACDFYGYSFQELASIKIQDINQYSKELIKLEMQRAKAKERNYFEFKHKLSNGTLKDVEVYSNPIHIDGKNYLISIIHDITARKKAEQELVLAKEEAEEKENELNKAQKTASIGSWVWYIPENKLWWSDEMYRIFDIDKETFTGNLDEVIDKAIHPDDRQKVEQSNLSVIKENKPIPVEYRIIRPDGSIKYVLGKADEMVLDENGKSKLLEGIVKDITEYKLIENELIKAKEKVEESEIKFRNFFENSIVGKSMTMLNGEMHVNKAYSDILGYSEEDLSKLKWFEITYKDDIERDKEILDSIISGKAESARWEKRYIHKNGKIVWVDISTSLQKDYTNNSNYFITSILDISRRKEDEIKLIESKEKAEESQRELSKQVKENNSLLQGTKSVLEFNTFETTARQLFNSCIDLIGATSGYVALLSPKGDETEVLFLEPDNDICTVDLSLPMPIRGLREIVYRTGKPVFDNDFDNSKWKALMPKGNVPLKNVLFAPLIIDKKVVGLIGMSNKPSDFNEEDLLVASNFSEFASVALYNSRMHDDLLNAKEKAEENQAKFKCFFDKVADAIFTFNPDNYEIIDANKATSEIYGDSDKEANFHILKHTHCPAVLTENLFMDTERDCCFIISKKGRDTIAKLHFEGILKLTSPYY